MITDKILSIEISCGRVNLVLFKPGKKPTVLKSAVASLPEGAFEDGYIRDMDATIGAITEEVRRSGLEAKYLAVAADSSQMVIREVNLPPLKNSEIKSGAEFELSQSYPGITSTHCISFKKYSKENEDVRGVAVFCPIKMIEQYKDIAAALSADLKFADVGVNAFLKSMGEFSKETLTDKLFMLVDAEGDKSRVSIVKNNCLYMSRFSQNFSYDASESSKLASINENIKQVFDYFSYNNRNESLRDVYLYCDPKDMESVKANIEQTFNVNVTDCDEIWENKENARHYIAAGAALRSYEQFGDVNLCEDANDEQKGVKIRNLILPIGAVAAAGLILTGILSFQNMLLDRKQSDLQKDRANYQEVSPVMEQLADLNNWSARRGVVITAAKAGIKSQTGMLDYITDGVSSNTYLTGYTLSERGVLSITGNVLTRDDIIDLLHYLRSGFILTDVELAYLTANYDRYNILTDYSFAITALPVLSESE